MSPIIHCDANLKMVAYYVVETKDSNFQRLPDGMTIMETEYLAIIYALNEYFLSWQKELDARHDDLDVEKLEATGEYDFENVAPPSVRSPRKLPPPIQILSDNYVVISQLNRAFHIGNDKLRKLAQQVWQMTKHLDVTFQWVGRDKNLAGKMLK